MGVEDIIALLARHGQTATYGALAALFEMATQSVMKDREQTHQNSWIVASKTGMPSGYSPEQIDPRLLEFVEKGGKPLKSVDELRTWVLANTTDEDFNEGE
ncbi:hypothetical protein [Botrimarina hoheduenensis]|uniref:Methylated-DNA-[protein]-cysteine S-methyltransferase DNA binding domain-containing protein n=1 Tax=Botrimarina hoheduenensis TaxID=2528000 RepID=A0A5C5WD69_9BACT|nr:hypothetical protein [Botrimarina hoheduenensis]TWT48614.1 hypothetical protein Pla111_03890 [Botrimarina hoheduenensis]